MLRAQFPPPSPRGPARRQSRSPGPPRCGSAWAGPCRGGASGRSWVAALGDWGKAAQPCPPAEPAGWALLDALSWLPDRVAGAARRGRPDEFARYLEDLASATIAALPFVGHGDRAAPGDD